MTEIGFSLNELNARLRFFPRLREIFSREWLARHSKDAGESRPLLQWLASFGQDMYAREMVFGIERALSKLVVAPGYKELSSGLKATENKFWSRLGHLSLAAFFIDIQWEVELERTLPGRRRTAPIDLLVRRKRQEVGIELKTLTDLAADWTQVQTCDHYKDTPRFLEEIRRYPALEPVPLRDREQVTRAVRSRASKARRPVREIPCVLALDCSRSQEDAFLKEALASFDHSGVDAIVSFSVGGTDLYPEVRKIVKGDPWLETPGGNAFRLVWEGAARQHVLLHQEAGRITSLLRREYDPDAILLFGSVVQGRVRENSDLDILIIKPTERPYHERVSEVLSLTRPSVPADIFVYTPEEFDRLKEQGDFFITREVLPNCERVYERSQPVA
jgi:predicted nucleotidyltransferase